jgi:hypothetical protein
MVGVCESISEDNGQAEDGLFVGLRNAVGVAGDERAERVALRRQGTPTSPAPGC